MEATKRLLELLLRPRVGAQAVLKLFLGQDGVMRLTSDDMVKGKELPK